MDKEKLRVEILESIYEDYADREMLPHYGLIPDWYLVQDLSKLVIEYLNMPGSARSSFFFAALMWTQVPQWNDDWSKCAVDVPDVECHWYIVDPDNTFGVGYDKESAHCLVSKVFMTSAS